MRICLYNLTTGFVYRGIETWNIELAKALAELGIEVDIATGKGRKRRDDFVFESPNIKILEFPFVNVPRSPFFTNYTMIAFALRRILKRGYDFVLIHKLDDTLLAALLKRFSKRTKVIALQHGTVPRLYPRAFFTNDVHSFVSVSKFIQGHLRKFGIESTVIHGGVRLEKFRSVMPAGNAQHLKRNGGNIVLSTVSLQKWKGVQHLIEAFPIVQKEIPNAKLVIASSGPYRRELENLAKGLNLKNAVFIGEIPHSQIADYYNACDVFVDPAHGEALGLSICEAMACEKAVIASDSGGAPEAIEHGKTGLLFEDKNSNDLAEKIIIAMENPALRKMLGRNARRCVEKNFNWGKTARKFMKHLQAVA